MNNAIKFNMRQVLLREFGGYEIKRMPPIVFDNRWRSFNAVRDGQTARFIVLMDAERKVCVIQQAKGGKVHKFSYANMSDKQGVING
ncbi:hypothetical protein THMIRHAS_03880 [Thiosulfatimonas sediminis]|uniref:Uncharacterized protein n=1 Tax=Thiosulfatimonas sediminis TaxID=2675054 RepID=A0A6F8PSC1_9GAMM|nr:hypothetical protein [Thiosulfatimonas sediminis]BBP45015.1 hypothetical protein THMIRHAS_03880 [Thiosulfatimonas sediminis]